MTGIYTIGICEDEPWFAADLKKKVEQYLKEKGLAGLIHTFAGGEELLSFAKNLDVILMDIKLPGKDGMMTAKRLRELGKNCQIIFITAYEKYVFQAFDIDAVHYILKPVTDERLYPALDKAVKRVTHEYGKTLLAADGESMARVAFGQITYCEVFDHQVLIHTIQKEYRVSGTLDALEKNLDQRFFRCHRSYLVNMEHVTDKGDGYACLSGGGRVLISRRKQGEFTKRLLQVCRGEGIW